MTPTNSEQSHASKPRGIRVLRVVAGIFFLLLGVLGLVLPILQGILFLALAMVLLAPIFPPIHKLLDKISTKYPSMGTRIDHWEKRVDRIIEWLYNQLRKPLVWVGIAVLAILAAIFWHQLVRL